MLGALQTWWRRAQVHIKIRGFTWLGLRSVNPKEHAQCQLMCIFASLLCYMSYT